MLGQHQIPEGPMPLSSCELGIEVPRFPLTVTHNARVEKIERGIADVADLQRSLQILGPERQYTLLISIHKVRFIGDWHQLANTGQPCVYHITLMPHRKPVKVLR